MKTLKNEKILFAGLTGQIGFPLALRLAADNEVWGIARFRDEGKRKELEKEALAEARQKADQAFKRITPVEVDDAETEGQAD